MKITIAFFKFSFNIEIMMAQIYLTAIFIVNYHVTFAKLDQKSLA